MCAVIIISDQTEIFSFAGRRIKSKQMTAFKETRDTIESAVVSGRQRRYSGLTSHRSAEILHLSGFRIEPIKVA